MGRGSSKAGKGKRAKGGGKSISPQDAIKQAQENVTSLSQLEGSQKQINWAENIRNEVFSNLNAVAQNTLFYGRDRATGEIFYSNVTPEKQMRLNAVNDVRESVKRVIGSEKRAGVIIDDRDYMRYRDIDKIVTQVSNAKKAGQNVKPEHIDFLVIRNMLPTVFREKYRKK